MKILAESLEGGRLLGALCSSSVLPSELPKHILTDPKAEASSSAAWESDWLA